MATSSFECKGGDHKSHEVDVDDDQGWKDIRFEDIELGKQIGGKQIDTGLDQVMHVYTMDMY